MGCFYPQTLHRDFICPVFPAVGCVQGGEYAGSYRRHSLTRRPDAPDRPLSKIYAEILNSCWGEFGGCASHPGLTSATCLHAPRCLQCVLQAWRHSLFGDLVVNRNKRSFLIQVNDETGFVIGTLSSRSLLGST